MLDVGGGLGVDYDGSQTNFESSVNYTLEEYANDVVYHIQTVCDDAGVKHPTIVSESGRAIVAYHSVLIFNVLGVSAFGEEKIPDTDRAGRSGAAGHRSARDLREPVRPQRARELPRRPAGARHGAEPVQRRLPAAGAAVPGREPLFRHPRQAQEVRRADGGRSRGPAGPGRRDGGHLLLQLLAVPVLSRQLGHQAAVSGDADPPAEHRTDPPCGARRHHLRFRRQDRSVHRSARREAHAGAARRQRRSVLPGRVPGRRVPGDPRGSAQPVRRHPRRAREPGSSRATSCSTR